MRWIIIGLTLLCTFSLTDAALGQIGKDTELWQWTAGAPHHAAIVQVTCNGGIGTGVVISVNKEKKIKDGHEGYCLTAYHVVKEDKNKNEIGVLFRTGRKSKGCSIVEFDEEADVALIWAWIPEGVEPAKIATSAVQNGDKLEFAGLGGGSELQCCLRHFSGIASRPSGAKKIFADVPLLPGDSGGPVFNDAHELVGIISGGWFWWDGGVKRPDGSTLNATWPARASNLSPIRTLMTNAESTTTTITR